MRAIINDATTGVLCPKEYENPIEHIQLRASGAHA